MKKYILLGSNNPNPSKNNLKVIHTSDDLYELENIWETIENFYLEIGDIYNGAFNKKALRMIEKNKYLNKLFDIYFDSIIWTVDIIGIFETVKISSFHSDLLT